MTTFTVWKFPDPDGAEQAASILKAAEADRLIKILDHAVVTWPVGKPGPALKRTHDSTWHDTGWGALWGLLIGSLFFMPLLGAAAGAGAGALHQATDGIGMHKDELESIRSQVTEGTSALMVITDEGNLDAVGERFHGMHWTLVDTNLTDPERKVLIETFGGG
jgi:uncharacterized membrane protein